MKSVSTVGETGNRATERQLSVDKNQETPGKSLNLRKGKRRDYSRIPKAKPNESPTLERLRPRRGPVDVLTSNLSIDLDGNDQGSRDKKRARGRVSVEEASSKKSTKFQIFFCDDCDKVFTQFSELVYHKRQHTGERPYLCEWPGCGKRFKTSVVLKNHTRVHTKERPYLCTFSGCEKRFRYWKDLKSHKYIHSGETPFKCLWGGCTAAFRRKDNLKHHVYIHTGERPYKCQEPDCGAAFNQKAPLNAHVNSHKRRREKYGQAEILAAGESSTICANDSQDEDETDSLASAHEPSSLAQPTHVNQNLSQGCFKDMPPINVSKNISQMPQHYDQTEYFSPSDIMETSLIIDHLSPTFNASRSESSPTKTVGNEIFIARGASTLQHSVELQIEPSSPAGDSRLNVVKDYIHRERNNYRLRSGSASFATTCSSRALVKTKAASKDSRKSSTRIKLCENQLTPKRANASRVRSISVQTSPAKDRKEPFGCDVCQKVFRSKCSMTAHKMIHSGEKPTACDWPGCDYRCITKGCMARHRLKHTGEKNHPCIWPDCEKRFTLSSHLKEHKKIHTGEKPYKCDWVDCEKWFARKDHLSAHHFTHTGEKPKKCPFPGCDAAFIQRGPLRKHLNTHKIQDEVQPNHANSYRPLISKSAHFNL